MQSAGGPTQASVTHTMIIRDETSSVEIALLEMGLAGTPASGDVRFDVAVTASATIPGGPFTGRNDAVWIGRDVWAGFLADLRTLERTRRGVARVSAMSPATFRLTVLATDRAGHMAAEGWVGRQYAGRGSDEHDRVCFSVQLDPSALAQFVSEFEALVAIGS